MVFWDIVAPFYNTFEFLNKSYKQMIRKVCELTPQGASVLELAGGTGEISLAVSRKAGSALCTDISDRMLRIAKRNSKKRRIGNVAFENVNVFETGKPDNSFDVVIASQVLHLIEEPQGAVEEIKRVTKDMAIIVIPLLKWGRSLARFVKHELDEDGYKVFLEEMGLNDCEYHIIKGGITMGIAVWRKN